MINVYLWQQFYLSKKTQNLTFTVHVLDLLHSVVAALELFQHYIMSRRSSQITEGTQRCMINQH